MEINLLVPVWVIGSYDKAGKANMMAAAWVGICCSSPPAVTVSLRKATSTYHNIMERKAFTVNVPSEKYVRETDFFGLASGRDTDKLALAGLTPVRSSNVDAPYIKEFPVKAECKLLKTLEVGLHTMFIGEIIDTKPGESAPGGPPSMMIFDPKNREYLQAGKKLGKAFSIGEKLAAKRAQAH